MFPSASGDDAKPWRFRVEGTHALIAGATGAGKGSVLWSLIHGLSPAIREGWVQVWALDPKGGMELGLGRGAFARFEGGVPEAMCDLLEEAVDLKTRRSLDLATKGERLHRPSVASPHLVIIIDELATLSAFAERTVVRRIEHALGLLLTQGRAVGITVIAAVQDPGKDVVSWRDLFPTRIAMRLDNPIQVDMVLGDGARERGAQADHISELTPGVAYVRVEGSRDVRRVRSAYLTDADVLALSTSLTRPQGRERRTTRARRVRGGSSMSDNVIQAHRVAFRAFGVPLAYVRTTAAAIEAARRHPLASAGQVRHRHERGVVHGPADAGGSRSAFRLLLVPGSHAVPVRRPAVRRGVRHLGWARLGTARCSGRSAAARRDAACGRRVRPRCGRDEGSR